jgi:hypothetical protein
MEIWYTNVQPDIWNSLNHGAIPMAKMKMVNSVLSKAVLEGVLVDQNSDRFHESWDL